MSHWKDGACGACAIGNSIEIHRNFGVSWGLLP